MPKKKFEIYFLNVKTLHSIFIHVTVAYSPKLWQIFLPALLGQALELSRA